MRNIGICNLDVYITGHCNYKCEYCYGEKDMCPDMADETYQRALDFAAYIGAENIQMCGGEPLVCKKFKSFTLMAKERTFNVILRTNGYFLSDYIDFVAQNCLWVGVSIDGLTYSNDKMRPSNACISAQEKFERPIKAIQSLKKENPNIKIILATLASKLNYKDIPLFAQYIQDEKLPIDKWKIYEFIRDKFRSNENYSKYEMTENEFDELSKSLPETINGAEIILQSAHTERVGANCLIVYQNGDINLSGVHYGNVNTDEFDDIIDRLYADNALMVIGNNKKVTYGEHK